MSEVPSDLGELAPPTAAEPTAATVASPAPPSPVWSLDVTAVTKGLLPITCDLVNGVDAAVRGIDGQRLEALKNYPPGHEGHDAARYYCKGLRDALLFLQHARTASADYREWVKNLQAADQAKGGGR